MRKIILVMILSLIGTVVAWAQVDESQYVSKRFKVGEAVTELSGKSPNGTLYKFSEINKGRYVIVDFWASWCKPCRASNPHLVKGYESLKGKKFKNAKNGMTVLSVSLDMNADAWTKAIKQDKLSWEYHMSDMLGWESELATSWGVELIPHVFLISPEGKLLGVYLSADNAINELKNYIIK